jgi:electron transport complex protein RnfB
MWTAILTISLIALIAGIGLSYAAQSLPPDSGKLVDQINDMLPQTQCAQCGYAGCRPYAEAIVNDGAEINLCPPGGDDTIRRLADTLAKDVLPLAEQAVAIRAVAIIDETLCIGCTHCRSACPVDAIVGAHQLMHTIIEAECTGCELCVAPCPVDCISMRRLA